MKNDVKVGVILSLYISDTVDDFLKATDSILNQSYNCDLHIYCDGPLDSEVYSYLLFLKKDKRVVVYENDVNKGLAYGLNFLIDKMLSLNYKYIARMDSDDISRTTRIFQQVKYLEKELDVDVLGTSCAEFGATYASAEKHLPKTHDSLLSFSITRCPFIHPTVMFRRSVFEGGIRYPTDTSFTEDMALWFVLLENGFKFSNLNDVLLDYRLNENTVERRHGFSKALSEFNLRLKYMFRLRQFTLKNLTLIISRLFFHVMPIKVMKFAYKKLR
jgi:hypothetical protein